jgi:tetratricopeptide (TPR) repeat protein
VADGARHDEVGARARLALMALRSDLLGKPQAAREPEPHVEAALERLGQPADLAGRWRWIRGNIFLTEGRLDESLAELDAALALLSKPRGEALSVAAVQQRRGFIQSKLGKLEDAEKSLQMSLELHTELLGGSHPDVGTVLGAIAGVARRRGEMAKAEGLLRQALQVFEASLGKEHPRLAEVFGHLGLLGWEKRDYAQAATMYRRALEIRRTSLDEGHPDVASALSNLAHAQRKLGQLQEARTAFEKAIQLWERSRTSEHPVMGDMLYGLGLTALAQDDLPTARTALERALKLLPEAARVERCEVSFGLAQALWTERDWRAKAAAMSFAQEADRLARPEEPIRTEIDRWLATKR